MINYTDQETKFTLLVPVYFSHDPQNVSQVLYPPPNHHISEITPTSSFLAFMSDDSYLDQEQLEVGTHHYLHKNGNGIRNDPPFSEPLLLEKGRYATFKDF